MITISVDRPAPAARSAGSLGFELFQTAYVTTDLDEAMHVLGSRYGVSNWTVMEPGGGMRIGLAWTHGHQIEVIQATGTGLAIYTDWLDDSAGFRIRLHHFGYYIHDDAEWAELNQLLASEGKPIVFGGDGGIVQFAYVDAPELGHYLEYVYPNAEGKAIFEAVKAN